MEKILKKYTTIPNFLYVERNADNQLKKIIEEMQRPGYVLVARQMGKTNLLINAKRIMENENRFFSYIDLSNIYKTEIECYRNIINNIIEPKENLYNETIVEIEELRQKKLSPHNEYSKSLRIILNKIKGDLIIILDEIDALKSLDYSDNIFAQIRSNYFSRTNYKEFERLTYVLSGVIEPTDLINDKNKSPFNIGEKIYLDDFNYDEYLDFIKKSKLELTEDVIKHIYDWANGNPRLTFDICSEIEGFSIDNNIINKNTVDKIINEKYLKLYDIPPIDHIRELIKNDKALRASIIKIFNDEINLITYEEKKKLYLHGIINSDFNGNVKIKNKIIELSISEEWINSLKDNENEDLFSGMSFFTKQNYSEAIRVFETLISNPSQSKYDIETIYYFLGFSNFKIGNLKKAIEYLSFEFTNSDYIKDSKSFKGICEIALGNKKEGLNLLYEYINEDSERNNYAYQNALLNISINIDNKNESISLLEDLYDSTFKNEDIELKYEINDLRTLALYYQAIYLFENKKYKDANIKIDRAFNYASEDNQIHLIYTKFVFSGYKDFELIKRLTNNLINNKIVFQKYISTNPLDFEKDKLFIYLGLAFKLNEKEYFNNLLNYSRKILQNSPDFDIFYEVLKTLNFDNKILFLEFIEKTFEINNNNKLIVFREYALIYYSKNNMLLFREYFNTYLSYFKENNILTNEDITIFAIRIKDLNDQEKDLKKALEICKIIENKKNKLKIDNYNFILIYNWLAYLNYFEKNKVESMKYISLTLNLIKIIKENKPTVFKEEGLKIIKDNMDELLKVQLFQ